MTDETTTIMPSAMSSDRTEQQDDSQRREAQEKSLQRARPPVEVPGYEPQDFLGSGAYGEVWVALDLNTGRRVAIKFYLHRGGLDWQLLSREVEKLVLLSSDRYVVQVLDVGWESTPPYYVMEYLENGSLEEYLRQQGALPISEAVELFRGVATGLMHAHGKGVLHCDVKPANVLLDQDHKPRLADFGQSRLSHEQKPALGTLFYMAPEQADLAAMPDARWDVYALGVLLYIMLTGELPYRDEASVLQIDLATGLEERLGSYRSIIKKSPHASAHRKIPGIDRALVDIVDRCLAKHPDDRYPNVQQVLDALTSRDKARARRPLLTMGLLGPALLLLVMSFFGWRGYDSAVKLSDQIATERADESSKFAAQFVAGGVANELERYFRSVENVADNPKFVELIEKVTSDAELGPMLMDLEKLVGTKGTPPGLENDPEEVARLESVRDTFESHPARQDLQCAVSELLSAAWKPKAASWFITNERGSHLASAFEETPVRSPIGRNFAYRSYFTFLVDGLPEDARPDREALEKRWKNGTNLSGVFKSTASGSWKVAISTPIFSADGKRVIGIVAMTVDVGDFLKEFESSDSRFAVLVDARQGEHQGVVLQHRLFEDMLVRQKRDRVPDKFSTKKEYRVDTSDVGIKPKVNREYQDPLGTSKEGSEKYGGRWIAAKAAVQAPPNTRENGSSDNARKGIGWVVLVQESYDAATEPAHQLGGRLVREGLTALGLVLLVVTLLWYFVIRALGDQRGTASPRRPGPVTVTPGNEATLASPSRHST